MKIMKADLLIVYSNDDPSRITVFCLPYLKTLVEVKSLDWDYLFHLIHHLACLVYVLNVSLPIVIFLLYVQILRARLVP